MRPYNNISLAFCMTNTCTSVTDINASVNIAKELQTMVKATKSMLQLGVEMDSSRQRWGGAGGQCGRICQAW